MRAQLLRKDQETNGLVERPELTVQRMLQEESVVNAKELFEPKRSCRFALTIVCASVSNASDVNEIERSRNLSVKRLVTADEKTNPLPLGRF